MADPVPTTAPAAATAAPAEAETLALDPATLFEQVAAKRITATIKGAVKGITPEMLRKHLNRKASVTADELRNVTEDLAREILLQQFWRPLGGDKHPDVAAAVFDIAVRRGHTDDAIKIVQAAIPMVQSADVKKDGRKGNQTDTAIEALKRAGKDIALLDMIDARRRTLKFRIGDGKFLGADIDSASAASLVLRFVASRII